jgi:hypothetical protein
VVGKVKEIEEDCFEEKEGKIEEERKEKEGEILNEL